MPKDKKDLPKKQAKRGNLPLPVDVIEELRDWKRAYEIAWSDPAPDGEQYTMTYEQLIRRLLEGVKRLDPEVWATHEAARKSREEQEGMMADFRRSFWSELKSTKAKLDGFYEEMMREIAAEGDSPAPADDQVQSPEPVATPEVPADPTEGEVWKKGYYFEKDGVRQEAFLGTKGAAFYAVLDGEEIGFGSMMYRRYKFYNSDGIELTKRQAEKISEIIRTHRAKA